jgi:dephospho-CoA kinase
LKEQFGADFLLTDIVVSDDEVRYGRMLARGSARDGASAEKLREFDANEEAIFRTSEREKLADVTILNDSGAEDFYAAIEAFYAQYVA